MSAVASYSLAGMGCAGAAIGGKKKNASATASEMEAIPEGKPEKRRLEVRLDERNLAFETEHRARAYLERKLTVMLARKLAGFGFAPADAGAMARKGRLTVEKLEKKRIRARRGDGKIREVDAWHVAGTKEVVLADEDIAVLCRTLASLPLPGNEAAVQFSQYLAKLSGLGPPDGCLDGLRARLCSTWKQLLEPTVEAVARLSAGEAGYAEKLESVTANMRNFSRNCGDSHSVDKLERRLGVAWWKWIGAVEPSSRNLSELEGRVARLEKLAAGQLKGAVEFVRRAEELAWRDRLVKLDEKKLDFDELREDFLAFLRKFPHSRFYPEMELRFVARWVGKLLGFSPRKPQDMLGFAGEVELLKSRFPHLSELGRVMKHFGELCLDVLEKVEIDDLDTMRMVRKVEKSCDSALPAGIRTVKVRKRLDDIQGRLERQLADRREKAELRGFEFFRMWDNAIRELDWGSTTENFARKGKFAELWKEGQDAGEDCQCTFDPESPCKLFDPDAESGGYEVVARFFEGRLYGIDLCNIMVTSKLPAVYKFLSRRYRPAHSRTSATRFLEAATGRLRFEGRHLLLWLECRQGVCTLRVAEKKAWARKQKAEERVRQDRQRQIEQMRRQRLERGWKKQDCVEWSCGAACTARGKVVRAEGRRYLVLVDRNPEEPLQVGRRVWIRAEELNDCQ